MDLIIWSDRHATHSFNNCVQFLYDNIRSGLKTLQKNNFTNWFVTKTSLKGAEQHKLKKSLAELFLKFDEDNSKIIDFVEFKDNFWWIEVFFEG